MTTSTNVLSTCPNHVLMFSTNFSTIGATDTLSNGVIHNPIMSSLTTSGEARIVVKSEQKKIATQF